MRSFSALASFAALTLVVLKVEVLASPIHSGQDAADDSTKISSREPVLPGIAFGLDEDHLLIRDNAYGWDHPHWHHYGGYHRRDNADLDDTVNSVNNVKRTDSYGWDHRHWHKDGGYYRRGLEVANTKNDGQHYGPYHHFNHWRHHHHFFPRDDASIDVPQGETESGDMANVGYYHPYHHRKGYYPRSDTDSESAAGALDQVAREEGYGHRHHHHQKIYYRRDDIEDDAALLSLDEAKREEGYGRHRHHKGYGYRRRDEIDADNSLPQSDLDEREEGYYRHRYHPKNHWRRDGELGEDLQDGSLDERAESVDQYHRYHQHKYPRDDAHHGWRWRHHRKFFHREDVDDLPSELGVESVVERDVEFRHPYYRRPREVVAETDKEGKKDHSPKSTAEDVEEGVTHGLATGAKETAGGIVGLDL